MTAISLKWINHSKNITGQRVYRSLSPIDINNLPEPLAVIDGEADSFTDDTVEYGNKYYYLVSSFVANRQKFSNLFEIDTNDYPESSGPGPKELIGYNDTAGFFGEVPVEDLISGNDLASMISLSAGGARDSNEPWLKFFLDDKVLFVAKRTYRHQLSWNDINEVDAVYGDRILTIQGYQFRIRLLKGADTDPATFNNGNNPIGTHRSEWNRLIYNVHEDIPDSQVGDNWASYNDSDLNIVSGNGRSTWCQETRSNDSNARVFRGGSSRESVSYANSTRSSTSTSSYGWRPVLELVTS